MSLQSKVWPKDPINFATWALTEEGRIAIAMRVTGHSRSGPNSEGRVGHREYDHVIALQKAIDEIGVDPIRWNDRFDNIAKLQLLAHTNEARGLIERHRQLCEYLDESAKAGAPWSQRNAEIQRYREDLNLVVSALRRVLATAKPQA